MLKAGWICVLGWGVYKNTAPIADTEVPYRKSGLSLQNREIVPFLRAACYRPRHARARVSLLLYACHWEKGGIGIVRCTVPSGKTSVHNEA